MKATLKALVTQRTLTVLACFIAVVGIASFMAYREGVQQKVNPSSAASCTVSATLVNSCRPWLGAWAVDYPQAAKGTKNQILYHEQRIGKQVDLVKDYKTPGGALGADDKYFITRANTYLLLTWKPAGSFGGGASSSANSSIDAMANSIKSVAPHKIFLSIWHEPENDVSAGTTSCKNAQGGAGSPAQYVAMWQNVHNRFAADGVTNVVWTYIPMGYSGWNCMEKSLWPGNNLVDWIMWDPYGSGDSDSWDKTISSFYNWMTANTDSTHAYTSKPWGIAETSIHWYSNETSGVKYWQEAKAALDANTYPRLKAYVVFDSTNGKPDNRVGYWCKAWTNETCNSGQTVADPNKAAAYKAFANDPVFSSSVTTCTSNCGGGDTQKPTVSISNPSNGATVSGSITVTASATDNVGVTKVVFAVDGVTAATSTGKPYSVGLDTTKYSNATHTLTATAYDAAGNSNVTLVNVAVNNTTPPPPPSDTQAPTASITAPADNAKVSGTISFTANATDNVAVAKVVFTVDGNVVATDMSAPYSTSLNTALYANGSHVIRAKAYDTAGNAKTPQKSITVSNTAPVPDPKINSFTVSPTTVTVGTATRFNWSSTNAINCSVSPDGPQHTTITTWTSAPYTSAGTKTYTLTCYNSAGKTVTATVKVTVNAPPTPPAVPTFSADKTTIVKGGNVLLSWSAAGASSCTLNPGAIKSSGATGSKLVSGLKQTTTYTIACANSAGSRSSSLKVTVTDVPQPPQPPAIISFTATPGSLSYNGTSTLSWTTSNVVSNGCSLKPSPLSSAAASGQWVTPALTGSASYTLTCKNVSGVTASKSLSLIVAGKPAPPPPAPGPSTTPGVSTGMVTSLGGQSVVNAQDDDSVKSGQLVTLDPSNVTDQKKAASILRVEYYNGEKLIATVSDPPYALNTKGMQPGLYSLTERTYYDDGSMSERTQDITVTAAPAASETESLPLIWKIAILVGGLLILGTAGFFARRRLANRAMVRTGKVPEGYDALTPPNDSDRNWPMGGPTVG